MTAEEVTAKRRAERQQFKLDRARAMAEAAREAETVFASTGVMLEESSVAIPSSNTWKPEQRNINALSAVASNDAEKSLELLDADLPDEEELVDMEHLQLTLQEAFFLLWTMGCLSVFNPASVWNSLNIFALCPTNLPQSTPFSLLHVWKIFQNLHHPHVYESSALDTTPGRFDNPFIINYVVYHHYRSLGWVARGGVKFCVDYLLYKRGPVFSHAE